LVIPLVKSEIFPTTPAEKSWTLLTTLAAKAEPGRLGSEIPPPEPPVPAAGALVRAAPPEPARPKPGS
jgi:hypothetical protein